MSTQPGRALTTRIAAAGILSAAALAIVACGSPIDTQLRDNTLRHEEAIADCMAQKGFEYVPSLPADVLADEARQHAEAAGEDGQTAFDEAMANAPADPNEELVAELDPATQEDWYDALWGDENGPGCYDATYAQAWGVEPEDITAQAQALYEKVSADPEVLAALEDYIDCMAQADFVLEHPDEIHALIGHHAETLDDETAEQYVTDSYAIHDTCVAPYDEAFNDAYDRHSD